MIRAGGSVIVPVISNKFIFSFLRLLQVLISWLPARWVAGAEGRTQTPCQPPEEMRSLLEDANCVDHPQS